MAIREVSRTVGEGGGVAYEGEDQLGAAFGVPFPLARKTHDRATIPQNRQPTLELCRTQGGLTTATSLTNVTGANPSFPSTSPSVLIHTPSWKSGSFEVGDQVKAFPARSEGPTNEAGEEGQRRGREREGGRGTNESRKTRWCRDGALPTSRGGIESHGTLWRGLRSAKGSAEVDRESAREQ